MDTEDEERWIRGARELGVIARDIRRDQMHVVRAEVDYQEAQAAMLQYMCQTERIATLSVALQMDGTMLRAGLSWDPKLGLVLGCQDPLTYQDLEEKNLLCWKTSSSGHCESESVETKQMSSILGILSKILSYLIVLPSNSYATCHMA